MKKILEELKGPRGILAISIILSLPALICSMTLGYVPLVALILLYLAGVPFLYLFATQWGRYWVGLLIKGIKYLWSKLKSK